MSYDRKLDWTCSHYVSDEGIFVANDRVTVEPLRPIASAASVRLRLNGELDVGPLGHAVPAEAIASRTGPFTIHSGVNDTLVVQAVGKPPQTIVIPAGRALSVAQIGECLASQLPDLSFKVTSKQRLNIQTKRVGPEATLMFLPDSTLAATLGLPVNRQWRGRMTVPRWSLIADPNTLPDRPTRLIVFDTPLKGLRDFVEISYTTLREECRRCGGLGIENDWRYDPNGEVVTIEKEALLIQEIQKMVYTVRGSNVFHLWYGTDILNTVGKKLSASGLLQQFIVADIREAFKRWQVIKTQQEDNLGQPVSNEEFPFQLLEVVLTPSTQDPTVVFVNATVQNRSSKPIQIERGVRLPSPDDLLGASAQDGIFRQSLRNFVKVG